MENKDVSHVSGKVPQYMTPPEKENLIGEELPSEMLDRIFSILEDSDLGSASQVSRDWNVSVLDTFKRSEMKSIKNFIRSVNGILTTETSQKQKEHLSNLLSFEEFFQGVGMQSIRKDVGSMEAKIKSILESLEGEDFDRVFDAFQGKEKPQLFYDCVFNSPKNRELSEALHKTLEKGDPSTLGAEVNELLNEGVIPHPELRTLSFAVGSEKISPELLKSLLSAKGKPNYKFLNDLLVTALTKESLEKAKVIIEVGARPTDDALKKLLNAGTFFHNLEGAKILLDHGVVPSQESISRAIDNGGNGEFIRAFIDAGGVPTEGHLTEAMSAGVSEDVAEVLMEKGAKPSNATVTRAITQGKPNEMIEKLLENGATLSDENFISALNDKDIELLKILLKHAQPTEEVLKNAVRFDPSKEKIELLLDARIKPTREIFNIAFERGNDDVLSILAAAIHDAESTG